MSSNEIKVFFVCDFESPVKFTIGSLSGSLPAFADQGLDTTWRSKCPLPLCAEAVGVESSDAAPRIDRGPLDPLAPELCVEYSLYTNGQLFGLPSRTRHATWQGESCRWAEDVQLSVNYSDLTANAQLAFTVWDIADPRQEVALGGATLPLFTHGQKLRTGIYTQHLWVGREADGSIPSSTPGKLAKAERGELERLEKAVNKYNRGDMANANWLDRLAFQAIGRARERGAAAGGRSGLRLMVELPLYDRPMLFQEPGGAFSLQQPLPSANELVKVWDPEVDQKVNPSEHKQLKLARKVTRGMIDRDLKPNSGERKQLATILGQPPTRALSGEERQLLWRFRFSLVHDRRALAKFLRCTDWGDRQEAKQATELMHRWAPIEIADALELLSPAFTSEEVRGYAVAVLERAGDEELQGYLLQLVQALRYERSHFSPLADFLVRHGVRNFEVGNFVYWYVVVEYQDQAFAVRYRNALHAFHTALNDLGVEGKESYSQLQRQSELAQQLVDIWLDLKEVRGGAARKVERLRHLLSPEGKMSKLAHFNEPLRLPLDPQVRVVGIAPQECSVFKSALTPLRLTFRTEDGGKCRIIFKKGDDLRQDQLIIQMVSLMDRLLKKENLDLKLTPYAVLATGADHGMVQFVPSTPLAQVLAENRTIMKYLQQFCSDEDAPFGVSPECVETFVKSCAGYCVIMYILGVGDRHLDNLLLCEDGRLFHIDFGFILGRDPKPFPPPMKLCKEMVEAMGGADSPQYGRFKSYCCEAYNILRKSANLILNLFHLMAGANIPDIASDPEKGILKLQQKFRLDLDDEAAVQFFQTLINESVSALFPQMVETIHRWAQYWR